MNGIETRRKINENNEKIRKAVNTFILNKEIQMLMAENESLRKECEHHFINGVCEYCDAYEDVAHD